MEKDGNCDNSERKDGAGLLDPANLFAYWPRGDSGTSAATNALFGGYGRGSASSGGRGHSSSLYPQAPGFPANSHQMSNSSAMWWNMCSQSATYEYMRRLQQISVNGWPGAESILPNLFTMPMHPKLSPAVRGHMPSTPSPTDKEKEAAERERGKERERELREREREREHRERERERDREHREREKERDRAREQSLNRIPVIAHSGSKADHLASIAALVSSGTSVSSVPPLAHTTASDSAGILSGVRLPPDTEIIKYTSSIIGPKVPGTTNRGRKKTISLDPPSVSVVPTLSSTGLPLEMAMDMGMAKTNQVKGESEKDPELDGPLNLCTKPRNGDSSELRQHRQRPSRRKPIPKQRRPLSSESNPIMSLSAMSQQLSAPSSSLQSSASEDDLEPSSKDGRPRNLGRGVSKPKKNTVASLLAQSRAALKNPISNEAINSHLALLHNLASITDPSEHGDQADTADPSDTTEALEELKIRLRSSEDGSFTTDSTSTGGSDSETEPQAKPSKQKKEPKDRGNKPQASGESLKSKTPKTPEEKSHSSKDSNLTQDLMKQKELLYVLEVEKERRRQHMVLVKMLDVRKRIEEREKKRIELKTEKIAKQEKKMEQRKKELELLKELKRPTEDMELNDLGELPEFPRIPGLKLSGAAFADTLLVFEFLHNFGETLGFDMESLPTLSSLQGALLNHEENEEELLSIMTHLLVCAIEDPGVPNPARHITLLGQSLKQADITHANLSEILRIYLYANATGEVKALTGLNFERDREKRITEHHNLYGEEVMAQSSGKNAAFFEQLYNNPTYKLSEQLKQTPFLALNPTTKSAILAFLCNELLQNKAVLKQIEGSMEGVLMARRERWTIDQSIRKLRVLYERHCRYMFNMKHEKDGTPGTPGTPSTPSGTYKDKTADDSDDDSAGNDEFDHDPESITQPDEDVQNLNVEEVTKRLEKFYKQQEVCAANILKAGQQIRATCLGQDRYYRRYWCLPKAGSVYVEGMESAQPDTFEQLQLLDQEDCEPPKLEPAVELEEVGINQGDKGLEDMAGTEPPALEDCHVVPCKRVMPFPLTNEPAAEKRPRIDKALHSEGEDNSQDSLAETLEPVTSTSNAPAPPTLTNDKLGDADGEKDKSFSFDLKRLSEKAAKCDDEDLLLRAMKNELSSRIFGSPSPPVKKEPQDQHPYLYRNTGSPLPNGDQFNFSLLNRARSLTSEYDTQSFSILPKQSCHSTSLLFLKNQDGLAGFPKRGGLPPSPGPLPPCDSPAPLVLTPDEAYMLELIKTQGFPMPAVKRRVPPEKRRGWWRISSLQTLKEVMASVHGRGIRERELKRMLIRFGDSTLETGSKLTSMTVSNQLTELDERLGECADECNEEDGAPPADVPGSWNVSVAQRILNSILEQVENLEDKVASASMQVKGWRVPSRTGDDQESPDRDIELAKQRLISLEAAIERRYLKPPLGFPIGEGGIGLQVDQDESIPKGLSNWRDAVAKSHTAAQLAMALYMLESCIAWDKSIMKANCQFCLSGDNEDKLLLCDGCDKGFHMYCFKPKLEVIPDGDWYCHECKNKVSGQRNCIVCGKRTLKNFVLCEHCPRAYHSDCLNPPLHKAPRGKWNCNSCSIKFPKKKCGRKVGWRKNRDSKQRDDFRDILGEDKSCDRLDDRSSGETDGEDLPLSAACSFKGDKECAPLSPIPTTMPNASVSDEPPPLSPQQPPPPHSPAGTTLTIKKDRISKKFMKELTLCKQLLEEMELQDEAWPFLLPVNTKQFPTYKKIIKVPMDLSTIKKKLNDEIYKTKEEFVDDVRQIFNNCETFNEDDSPVGKAGHAMRSFFEMRWGELNGHKPAA